MDNTHFLMKTRSDQCIKCNGTGLIYLKCKRVCKNCNNNIMFSGKKCYICENIWKLGNLEECNICWGTGKQIKEKETKKDTKL